MWALGALLVVVQEILGPWFDAKYFNLYAGAVFKKVRKSY